MKKNNNRALIFAAIGMLLGILLIKIDVDLLIRISFVIFGIAALVSGIPSLIMSISDIKRKGAIFDIVISALSVAMGLILIFRPIQLLMIVVGIYLIVLPLIRILISNEKKTQLKADLPRMIIGVVMIILGPAQTTEIFFKIAGWAVIALTVAYALFAIISSIINDREDKKLSGTKMYVDTDGNGKIDAIYIDKTGDGVFDKIIKIPETEDTDDGKK